MEERIERSQKLRETILRNKKLLAELSEKISIILKKHEVKLREGQTYVFVPHVFIKPLFKPEIFIRPDPEPAFPWWWRRWWPCRGRPLCGIIGPDILEILKEYRISEEVVKAEGLREQILGNSVLLAELSEAVSGVLKAQGVTFEKDETFVFSAHEFSKPIFEPELFKDDPVPIVPPRADDPIPLGIRAAEELLIFRPRPFPGIPAPEILQILERIRIRYR